MLRKLLLSASKVETSPYPGYTECQLTIGRGSRPVLEYNSINAVIFGFSTTYGVGSLTPQVVSELYVSFFVIQANPQQSFGIYTLYGGPLYYNATFYENDNGTNKVSQLYTAWSKLLGQTVTVYVKPA